MPMMTKEQFDVELASLGVETSSVIDPTDFGIKILLTKNGKRLALFSAEDAEDMRALHVSTAESEMLETILSRVKEFLEEGNS